jgi:hypothetical protein
MLCCNDIWRRTGQEMKYKIDLGRNKVIEVPKYIEDKIIKDYLTSRYHWVIGISMFLIGFLLGVVAK